MLTSMSLYEGEENKIALDGSTDKLLCALALNGDVFSTSPSVKKYVDLAQQRKLTATQCKALIDGQ